MAAAYSSFGNGGYYIKPYSYTKIILNETNLDESIKNQQEKELFKMLLEASKE